MSFINLSFSEEDIAYLEEVRWWNRDSAWVEKHAHCFDSVQHLRSEEEKG